MERRHGTGCPASPKLWDDEYRAGQWDRDFASAVEAARYGVVLGQIMLRGPDRSILELGTGSGRLLEWLDLVGFETYLGVDFSPEAVRRARALNIQGAQVEVEDFEKWQPPRRFDVILFIEALYYTRYPLDTLLRYAAALEEGGASSSSPCTDTAA